MRSQFPFHWLQFFSIVLAAAVLFVFDALSGSVTFSVSGLVLVLGVVVFVSSDRYDGDFFTVGLTGLTAVLTSASAAVIMNFELAAGLLLGVFACAAMISTVVTARMYTRQRGFSRLRTFLSSAAQFAITLIMVLWYSFKH